MKTIEQKQAEFKTNQNVAIKLRNILGPDYEVRFNDGESCMTRFFYKGHFYKEVPDTDMVPNLNVYNFMAPQELMYAIHFGTTAPTYF